MILAVCYGRFRQHPWAKETMFQPDDVRTTWGRIVEWLAEHAPETAAALAPPAPADQLAIAESELDFPLPPELSAWWSVQGGVRQVVLGGVLGGYAPYGLADMMATRRLMLDIADQVWDEWSRTAGAREPAGGHAWAFLPTLVPIARNGSGDDLVVDLRSGPLRGCVKAYDHEQGALFPPPWPSLTALLTDVAASLAGGTALGNLVPAVSDGRLSWQWYDTGRTHP
jgi:cell wall assembly regulator SMI1